MITKYVHGDESGKQKFFGKVGHWFVDENVHKELGIPVTAIDEDVWFLSANEEPDGFAQVRYMANNSAHLRYVYGTTKKTRESLISAVVKFSESKGSTLVYTNERAKDDVLPTMHFKRTKNHKGTNFIRWERSLI